MRNTILALAVAGILTSPLAFAENEKPGDMPPPGVEKHQIDKDKKDRPDNGKRPQHENKQHKEYNKDTNKDVKRPDRKPNGEHPDRKPDGERPDRKPDGERSDRKGEKPQHNMKEGERQHPDGKRPSQEEKRA